MVGDDSSPRLTPSNRVQRRDGMSSDPRDVVIAFCDAFERRSVQGVLAYLASDVVYQNVPIPAMHGVDEAGSS